jgi:tetratricopeptide (TPR) repeat protein
MSALLDIEERFRLALHASSQRDVHACIALLKKLLQSEPRHAGAVHLLAVQYAEVGLHNRALDGLRLALDIEPRMDVARLQLGLLLLDLHRDNEAHDEFAQLDASPDEGMRLCATAMAAAALGDRKLAADSIELSLSSQKENPSLTILLRALQTKLRH